MLAEKLQFTATSEKGQVTALLDLATDARALIVLAHGAGADIHHHHIQSITNALNNRNLATLRFNFPYMESGHKRTDRKEICIETFSNALEFAHSKAHGLPVFIGGHSFGGRMSSHFYAERAEAEKVNCKGLVYFSFPLHPSKKPDIKRAEHLYAIRSSMLFLSGTRDTLADSTLLEDVVSRIPSARLYWLETADHGFKILKRSRQSAENVYDEAARVTATFVQELI